MKLAKPCPENCVLNPGQDFVADKLVHRHSAPKRPHMGEHPGAEDGASIGISKSVQQHWKAFRRILAISMQKSHEIVAALDCVMISKLLVSTIPLIYGIE